MTTNRTWKDFIILAVVISAASQNYQNHMMRTLRKCSIMRTLERHKVAFSISWVMQRLEGWAWFLLLYSTLPHI